MGYPRLVANMNSTPQRDFSRSEELLAGTIDGIHPLENRAILYPIIPEHFQDKTSGELVNISESK